MWQLSEAEAEAEAMVPMPSGQRVKHLNRCHQQHGFAIEIVAVQHYAWFHHGHCRGRTRPKHGNDGEHPAQGHQQQPMVTVENGSKVPCHTNTDAATERHGKQQRGPANVAQSLMASLKKEQEAALHARQ